MIVSRSPFGDRSRPFSYRRNVARISTYSLEQFWTEAQRIGFTPLAVTLVPHDELTGDLHLAYVMMVKDTLMVWRK